ncbi:MAG: PA2778 family cysteine peptidase [Pseudomonadota bacterium]|nr:PA2778 family cysteine peptidase [Pseudomonadota bacterium]
MNPLPGSDSGTDLSSVPFFPQTGFQCGPAALATVLVHDGVQVTPEVLADDVYLPRGYGSLQAELIGATRRHGRIPYRIGSLEQIRAALDAGKPVLVLQRVRNWLLPQWHYAVVVGWDRNHDRLTLRSGKQRRLEMTLDAFERTWNPGDRWAFVVLNPGDLPGFVTANDYLAALAGAEPVLSPGQVVSAYRAATRRWPGSPAAHFGLGNALYRAGWPEQAEAAWRGALAENPAHAGAGNNLAEAMFEAGRPEAALALLDSLLSGTLSPEALRPQLLRTRARIVAGMASASPAAR